MLMSLQGAVVWAEVRVAREAEHVSNCFGGSFKVIWGLGGPCILTLSVLPPERSTGPAGPARRWGIKVSVALWL